MERYSRVGADFNNNLPPRAAPSLFQTKPPSSHISLPPKPPTSSFLQDSSDLSIFDAKRYFDENPINTPRKSAVLLDENCNNNHSTTNPIGSPTSSVDGYAKNWRNVSFRATPTASSEASWNSQTGLLSNPPGRAAVSLKAFPSNERRKTGSPSFSTSRRFFGRNCPCYGKKSVDVEDKYSEPKSPIRISCDKVSVVSNATTEAEEGAKMKITAGSWEKDSTHRIVNPGFSFPILPPPRPPAIHAVDEPARDSLEVFLPANELPTNRRSAELPHQMSATNAGDDDAMSDASSDLFEIESFSTNSAYRRHDPLDEYPKAAGPTSAAIGMLHFRRSLEEMHECYAPSEVSVEWSVTTAEGGFDRASLANFSSAASDYEEAQFIRREPERSKKKGAGGFMSCRSQNSVNVGPNPVRIEPGRKEAGTAGFGIEPEISRFALQKAQLIRSSSGRMNRAVQMR